MNKNIDGIKISKTLYNELNKYLSTKSQHPKIVDISIGTDYGSSVYSKMKQKTLSTNTNIEFKSIHFEKTTYQELIQYIKELNKDRGVTGILIQLPLPDYLKEHTREILETISPIKDIDGLTSIQAGLLSTRQDCLVSCTALAIETLLKSYNINLEGKKVAILNRNNLIGIPFAHLMLKNNATPIICHSKTKNLKNITKESDIIVVSINKQEYITEDYIKEGTIVLDTGVHKNTNNKIVGDTDYNNIVKKASLITPPIGSIGPMTICMLAYNATKAIYGIEVNNILDNAIQKAKSNL